MTERASPMPTAEDLVPKAKPEPVHVPRSQGPRVRILQAVQDLTDCGRVATRQSISQITGLSMKAVDDCIKNLRDAGILDSPMPGVLELAEQPDKERAVTVTMLPEGIRRCKIEIGDEVLDLSVREARLLGELTAGIAWRFGR